MSARECEPNVAYLLAGRNATFERLFCSYCAIALAKQAESELSAGTNFVRIVGLE